MSFTTSLLLGITQGLTEFLPVSSSGHLVLVQSLFPAFVQPGVLFDVVLHAGTLTAVVLYFRQQILKLSSRYLLLIVVASFPAALVGYLFSSFFESLFVNPKLVGFALLATAAMSFFTDRFSTKRKKINFGQAFWVGLFQAVAIIPGISRSGSTIFAATATKIDRREAARFSFLLSVPAVLGANLLQFLKYGVSYQEISLDYYLVGFVAAAITGYLAIKLVYQFLLARNFKFFAVYCLLVGLGVILFF